MSGEVLYRKWRPQRFFDVVGQEHVTTTLKNAVMLGRTAHAYLFTGQRGVGKTSLARILAKALNCQNPDMGDPDDTCFYCVQVKQDKMVDMLEIDAASNRGIDDIRAIKESVRYSPTFGGWKVYIIDEVHMLTEPAFNALLKTLEEPPPKVVLVLATTESHKVPATIVSRCQRFDLRRIKNDDIKARLSYIAREEGIAFDEDAIELVATSAQGSMRDGVGILDKVSLLCSETNLTIKEVSKALGIADYEAVKEVCKAVVAVDPKKAIKVLNEQHQLFGVNPTAMREAILKEMHKLTLKVVDESNLSDLSKRETLSKLIWAISKLEEADFKRGNDAELTLELSVLKACTYEAPNPTKNEYVPPKISTTKANYQAKSYQNTQKKVNASSYNTVDIGAKSSEPDLGYKKSSTEPRNDEEKTKWEGVIAKLKPDENTRQLSNMLINVKAPKPSNGLLELNFRSEHLKTKFDSATTHQNVKQIFRDAIDQVYGPNLQIRVRYHDKKESATSNKVSLENYPPLVRYALSLGAKVVDKKSKNQS